MKKVLMIPAILAVVVLIAALVSCDDDTNDPSFTPSAKATIEGAISLKFESFNSVFSQEEINSIITSKYTATMNKNGTTYKLIFEYNDYFQELTYDLATSGIKTSFHIGDNVVYDQIIQGEFDVETKEDNKFDVNFGFIATSLTTNDTLYVTGGEISHEMD